MFRQRSSAGPLPRVALAFFVNGISSSVWVARVPRLATRLGTTPGRMGIVFALGAIGGIAGSRFAPRLLRGRAPARLMALAGLGVAAVLVARSLPTSLAAFGVLQVAAGGLDGVMDVSMNAEGVRLDRAGRSIMNRLHGLWSVGALTGGLIGSGLAQQRVAVPRHFVVAGVLVAVCMVPVFSAFREPIPPSLPRAPGPDRRRVVSPAILVLCGVGIAAALAEGAPNDWGSVYLRDGLHTGEGIAGLATVAFTGAMVIARFLGDHLVERFGSMRVLRSGALTAAAGLAVGLGVDRPWSVIAGWALIGTGIATAFPALFVAGSKLPGVSPEAGMGTVMAVARVGFLLGPLAIGALVDAHGIRTALLVPLGATLVMAAGATRLARDERRTTDPPRPEPSRTA